MIDIKVTHNIPEYTTELRGRAMAMSTALVAAINEVSKKLQARILGRSDSPASGSHRKKGWLANSVRVIPATATGSTAIGGVEGAGGDAWYGRLFEDGTSRAYEIAATNKKVLMFEMAGQQVFFKRVMHPPFDATRLAFMHPVFEEMQAEIRADLQQAAYQAMGVMGEG
jgi:hypothetical protein